MEVNQLFGVAGRVALVTGGSSGLGLMIAKVRQSYSKVRRALSNMGRDSLQMEPRCT